MANKKTKRTDRKNDKKSTLTVRASLSAGLVIFALAAANLSFMSYARDTLSGAINGSIAFETVKSIGESGLEGLKALADNAVTVFGRDTNESGNEEKKSKNGNDNETDNKPEPVIKIVPPESFLPEREQ